MPSLTGVNSWPRPALCSSQWTPGSSTSPVQPLAHPGTLCWFPCLRYLYWFLYICIWVQSDRLSYVQQSYSLAARQAWREHREESRAGHQERGGRRVPNRSTEARACQGSARQHTARVGHAGHEVPRPQEVNAGDWVPGGGGDRPRPQPRVLCPGGCRAPEERAGHVAGGRWLPWQDGERGEGCL